MVYVLNDVWVDRPSPGAPSRPLTILAFARGSRAALSDVNRVAAHGYDVQWSEDNQLRPHLETKLPERQSQPQVSYGPTGMQGYPPQYPPSVAAATDAPQPVEAPVVEAEPVQVAETVEPEVVVGESGAPEPVEPAVVVQDGSPVTGVTQTVD